MCTQTGNLLERKERPTLLCLLIRVLLRIPIISISPQNAWCKWISFPKDFQKVWSIYFMFDEFTISSMAMCDTCQRLVLPCVRARPE